MDIASVGKKQKQKPSTKPLPENKDEGAFSELI